MLDAGISSQGNCKPYHKVCLTTRQSLGLDNNINYRSLSTRLQVLTWWMFVCLITACYSANLAAFLTTQKFNHKINSVEELMNQERIKYGAQKHILDLLKNSKSDVHRKIAHGIEMNNMILKVCIIKEFSFYLN